MGNVLSISLEEKQIAWLDKHNNRSKVIKELIDAKIKEEMSEISIRKAIKLLTFQKMAMEKQLNNYYFKLKILLEEQEKMQNAEKERIKNLLKERKKAKKERFKKIESSPFFKEIQKMKKYDDEKAMEIIEMCRTAGNKEFGTYALKEYVEAKNASK